MSFAKKAVVRLTADQRRALERVVGTGEHPALTTRRARILLKADAEGPDHGTDEQIAQALDTTRMTVMRVRQQFVAEGLDAPLHRQKPTGRRYRKLDGAQEAHRVAIACSAAPEGQARWTMELLAQRLVERRVVESIDPSTVCRTLKKRNSSRGSSSSGSFRRKPTARW
jgi:transposase